MTYTNYSLRASNLNCIGVEPQGFDTILSVNVIVGRNNSGKSSLIDMVELAVKGDVTVPASRFHSGQAPILFFESPVTEQDVNQSYPPGHSNSHVGDFRNFGNQFIGTRIISSLTGKQQADFVSLIAQTNRGDATAKALALPENARVLAALPHRNPFRGKEFRRLAAERNILPEADSSGAQIEGDGQGATNVIQQFLNKAALPRDLVRKTLLNAINVIFNPDTVFEEILCRQLGDGRWEIFLQEASKGLIPLSQSGSGLKTVILALTLIHLSPVLAKKPLSEFVMAFEELENNLHPALQRRLIGYLAKEAVENEFPIFLTTHSSVSIDILNRNKDAQILHVTHDGTRSSCRLVRAYVESRGVLDDLDVRASDLLQANGVVWVEGPSDRVFLNTWISLWTNGELVEGNHYQCVFYGGRLLSHLSGNADHSPDDGVSLLRVNRNAALIMDSDRRSEADALNATKQRIITEIEEIGGITWVTGGREIENCIPVSVLRKWLPQGVQLRRPPGPYDSVYDAFDRCEKGLGKRYLRQKPVLAEELGLLTTKEDLKRSPDVAAELERLCAQIRSWNRLAEPTPL